MISVISTVAIASEHALKCCSHVRNMQFLSEARKLSKVGRLKGYPVPYRFSRSQPPKLSKLNNEAVQGN